MLFEYGSQYRLVGSAFPYQFLSSRSAGNGNIPNASGASVLAGSESLLTQGTGTVYGTRSAVVRSGENVRFYPFDPRKGYESEFLQSIPTLRFMQVPANHKILAPTVNGYMYIRSKRQQGAAGASEVHYHS